MNIQAINQELAKIGYKAVPCWQSQLANSELPAIKSALSERGYKVVPIKASKAKEARIPWPLGPKKLGAPKFRSRCYGSIVGSSTAARISLTEFAEIKKRSEDMWQLQTQSN
jgi:hypothetical protein